MGIVLDLGTGKTGFFDWESPIVERCLVGIWVIRLRFSLLLRCWFASVVSAVCYTCVAYLLLVFLAFIFPPSLFPCVSYTYFLLISCLWGGVFAYSTPSILCLLSLSDYCFVFLCFGFLKHFFNMRKILIG